MSPPAYLDRFRIVRQIGAGGMGTVYEAVDPEIARRVAIKVLRRDLLDENPELLQRLFVEARAANAIGHPGVVQISEARRLADGTGFLVMELLQGQTLTQRMRQSGGRLQVIMAVQLAIQIASTLRAGHQQGVIHRDLKPENIMLVSDDAVPGGERVKLLDFGIAKLAQDAGSAAPLTLADMGLGTPGYMAPEQMRDAAGAGAQSDVYGLGAVLFEMLSGRRPHVASNAADLVVQILSSDAPSVSELVSGVPAALAELLAQMLRREPPQARPAMVEVLQRLLVIHSELTAVGAAATTASGSMALPNGLPPQTEVPLTAVSIRPPPASGTPSELSPPLPVPSDAEPPPSASTHSQLRGQRVWQPYRWGAGVFASIAAVVLVVLLIRGGQPQPQLQPPKSAMVNAANAPPPTMLSASAGAAPRAPAPPDVPAPKPLQTPDHLPGRGAIERLPAEKHPPCEARPPRSVAISPADATVARTVQDAIKAYNLRLCKGERLVLHGNRGDGSLTVTAAPRALGTRSGFDASRFALRIQGSLAATGRQEHPLGSITISY